MRCAARVEVAATASFTDNPNESTALMKAASIVKVLPANAFVVVIRATPDLTSTGNFPIV